MATAEAIRRAGCQMTRGSFVLKTQLDHVPFLRVDEDAHDPAIKRRLPGLYVFKNRNHLTTLIGEMNRDWNIRVDAPGPASRYCWRKLPLIDGGADRAV